MRTRSITALALGLAAMGVLSVQANAGSAAWPDTAISQEQVAQIMTDADYTFEEAEFEDGMIEAEGSKDGQEWEVTINAETGEILSAEQDD